MSGVALSLVVAAAVFHVAWNVLAKGSRDKLAFFWCAGVAGLVVFLPAVLWWAPASGWSARVGLGLVLGAGIRAAYFAALGAAYTRGDLSLVYPLARGTAPVLVPVAAALLLGERLSAVGVGGIAAVAAGVYVLHLPGLGARDLLVPIRALRAGHARFALLTGLFTTTYSVVDKWNMNAGIPPLLYAYVTIPGAAMLLTPLIAARPGLAAAEWRVTGWRIPATAVLMTGGYLLVLLAMQRAPVGYVAPARELGIVFGVLVGSVALREGHLLPRATGAILIVLGVVLIAMA